MARGIVNAPCVTKADLDAVPKTEITVVAREDKEGEYMLKIRTSAYVEPPVEEVDPTDPEEPSTEDTTEDEGGDE